MFFALAIVCAVIGLAATGAVVYTVAAVFQRRHEQGSRKAQLADRLLRWTAWDYAVTVLACGGLVFLLVDLLAIWRDRQMYPDYRLGYLLCGFVFSLSGIALLFARLGFALRLAASCRSAAQQHQPEPEQADGAE